MKFGELLAKHAVPEWKAQYVDYEMLKSIIERYQTNIGRISDENRTVSDEEIRKFDNEFDSRCQIELEKVDLFFKELLSEDESKFLNLNRDYETWSRWDLHKVPASSGKMKLKLKELKLKMIRQKSDAAHSVMNRRIHLDLRFKLSELYLKLTYLQNYQRLNYEGFRKIQKKRDKIFCVKKGEEFIKEQVKTAKFQWSKEPNDLMIRIEHLMTKLDNGNRSKAMQRLRVPPLRTQEANPRTTFRLGFWLGAFIILLILDVISLVVVYGLGEEHGEVPPWIFIRLFRGWAVLYANIFLVAVNMYGWRRAGVNHLLIFELDPRDSISWESLMEMAACFGCIWCLGMLGYVHFRSLQLPSTLFPLLVCITTLLWTLNPLPILHRGSRYWFLRRVGRCLFPFKRIQFADFWMADQLTSMVTFLLDLEYTFCFYTTEMDYSGEFHNDTYYYGRSNGTSAMFMQPINIHENGMDSCRTNIYGIRPLIALLPYVIRFAQCIRRIPGSKKEQKKMHVANAGKYSTSVVVIIFGALFTDALKLPMKEKNPFFWLWICFYLISYVYALYWDLFQDWGLFEGGCRQYKGLREKLAYDKKTYYYSAVMEDTLLRLSWVLNVSALEFNVTTTEVLICVTAPLECFRRFVWNFFRLENEHLNNCGAFRAIRDISIKPLTQEDLEKPKKAKKGLKLSLPSLPKIRSNTSVNTVNTSETNLDMNPNPVGNAQNGMQNANSGPASIQPSALSFKKMDNGAV